MLGELLNAVFGCWHLRYSFPMTLRPGSGRRKATAVTGTYVVCLECGKELPYDWNTMKIVSSVDERRSLVASLAPKRAA
jgi:ribosomal protein S26